MSSSRTSTPFIVNVGVSAFSSRLASSRVAVDPSFVLHFWYYKRARLKLKIHCTKLPEEGEESNRDELRSINTLKSYFQESIANQRRPRFDSPFYTLKESKTDISLLSPSAFRNIKISASMQIYFLKNLFMADRGARLTTPGTSQFETCTLFFSFFSLFRFNVSLQPCGTASR